MRRLKTGLCALLLAAASLGPVTPLMAGTYPATSLEAKGRWSANSLGHAPVPPMGWNSWNAFYSDIDETKVLASAQILVDSGLAELGYRYVNIDDGWWLRRRQPDGRMVIRTDKFPSARSGPEDQTSFRPLTDRLHAMGLKAGIYSDIGRNSCGQVYTPHFANQPEGTLAEREVGLYDHIDQDIKLYFEEWGFDFIKVDACGIRGLGPDTQHVREGNYRELTPLITMNGLGFTDIGAVKNLYAQVSDALRRYNPEGDYVFSLCLWGSADVRSWAKDMGNMSRTSDDITPHWSRMLTNFDTVSTRALYAHPGAWNDPDMLFIGSGEFDASHMTEARSHLALWAIMNAPLIIGYDLRKATAEQLALLGNARIIALNQDAAGHQAVPAYQAGDLEIFVKTLSTGEKAVALFNRGVGQTEAILTAGHLKLKGDADITLSNLWTGETHIFRGEKTFRIASRETLIFKASGERVLADGLYLSEQPGNVNPAVDGVIVPQHDPFIHRTNWNTRGPGEHPQYGGWGGAQADRTPFGELLRVNRRLYTSGIGVLTNSRLEVRNSGYATFSAEVGVDDTAAARNTAVVFEVYGDGRLLTRSQPLRFGEAAQNLQASVAGVGIIELVVRTEAGQVPEAGALPVTWGNAALTKQVRHKHRIQEIIF